MVERRRHIWLLLAALLTVAALVAPTGARAQEDGVTVDPDSPSGREYDIPTERARREAGGDDKKKSNQGDDAPLFGEGVGSEPTPTPVPTVAPTATAESTASAAARKKAKARRERAAAKRKAKARREAEAREAAGATAATATPSPPPPVNAARASSPDSAGFSSWALIGGMAVALVVTGTGGGMLLRRRFGPS